MYFKKQDGIALVMVLVFLVVITLIGITSMTMARRQEQMAGATMDRMVALSASEAAVREGSVAIVSDNALGLAQPPIRPFEAGVLDPTQDGATINSWRTSGFDWFGPEAATLTGTLLARANRNPTYVADQIAIVGLEVRADRDQVLRVTSRGEGGRRTSEAYTQSFRAVPKG